MLLEKNKILIVDNEINIGLLVSTFLTKNGFEVSSTGSGATAPSVLKEQAFDLVLCDYRGWKILTGERF
ncbi:response regulator [Pedobacter sp. KBW01]|uniref:response regulator n=1 Tax=Pedobacter sp. KBW01 TaxID=2153364 RepID=UPI001319EAA9|nr:response regulator [Pedobacter sp. KBW01]